MNIKRVLVANRGEIACRVMAGLEKLGIATATVYSEADRDALHVRRAQRAMEIGPAAPTESYLAIDKVVGAAKALECDAIHPGYGFLSENAAFAEAIEDAGLTFLGPSADVIRKMGDKAEARRIATELGVPPTPGYEGEGDDATLAKEAEKIGYPLLVKAAHGGGGKGMRICREAGDLDDAIAAARREAKAAFGNDALILERFVFPSRHVEVQILGDRHGKVVALLERECSLQRRHQKVVEECPSPVVDEALRHRICGAAVRLAEGVGYVGAGTVEFLLDDDEDFFFLEMNTRLQVEHGVTELVTGEDLVGWQVRVAEGEHLPGRFDALAPGSHAIEVRLYAEDPDHDFLPQAGKLERLALPEREGIRIDSGFRQGDVVSPHYDPMLLKVMAHGSTREEARRRLVAALDAMVVLGPPTNLPYLRAILATDYYREARTYTSTLGEWERPRTAGLPDDVRRLVAVALAHRTPALTAATSPFSCLTDFRLLGTVAVRHELRFGDEAISLWTRGEAPIEVSIDGERFEPVRLLDESASLVVDIDGRIVTGAVVPRKTDVLVTHGGERFALEVVTHGAAEDAEATSGETISPMTGKVIKVTCAVGDTVKAGTLLVIVEAMKMEHRLEADIDGDVTAVDVGEGDQVDIGQLLVRVEPRG